MRNHRRRLIALLVVGFSAAPSAWATMENLKSYKQAHPGQAPAAYSCKVCHLAPVGNKDNVNDYGKALRAFKAGQGAKHLTVEDYQAFDAADTDGDSATNAQEIKAGTNPFDPASVPTGTPAASPVAPPAQPTMPPPVKKDDVAVPSAQPQEGK